MTTTINRPDTEAVASCAQQMMQTLIEHPLFARLKESTDLYPDCWGTYTGYPIIAEWDLDIDKGPLFDEAMRVFCLKAAVFKLTDGDEKLAELIISPPVDEMIHAVLAQANILFDLSIDTGIRFVHMTDQEEFGWKTGDWTDELYRAAWGVQPPTRYWIESDEVNRRLDILKASYDSIGMMDLGRRHEHTFGVAA